MYFLKAGNICKWGCGNNITAITIISKRIKLNLILICDLFCCFILMMGCKTM